MASGPEYSVGIGVNEVSRIASSYALVRRAPLGQLLDRFRFQTSVGFFLAVILPWLVGSPFSEYGLHQLSSVNALIGTGASFCAGSYFLRRLSIYPGDRGASYIIPTFLASFAVTLAIFFFGRFPYGRVQFLASFLICITWFYSVYLARRRSRVVRMGLVPVGQARSAEAVQGIEWVRLKQDGDVSGLNGIVADLRADIPDHWERFISDCAISGMPVYHVKQVLESVSGCVNIEHLSENPMGTLTPGAVYWKLKRLVDVIAALVAGILLLPFLALVAVLVKIDSPGPAFFLQRRVGFRGAGFTIVKFRTMTTRHETDDARASAITQNDDARVTRLGRVLRRTRIDELPQILNIVLGHMSWIGPRPEAAPLSHWYETELPFYRYRHIVRPGITGWAQVNQGHVAEVDDVMWKLQFDFYYIKYFSPWLDLLIVFRTIRTMLTGFGSR